MNKFWNKVMRFLPKVWGFALCSAITFGLFALMALTMALTIEWFLKALGVM